MARQVGLVLAAMIAALLSACSSGTAGPETGVAVADVWRDPGLVAERVTVSAQVQSIIAERAFTIAGGSDGVDPLLVLHSGQAEVPSEGPVRVTGVVRQALDIAQAERYLGFEFRDTIYNTYGADPYLEATAVEPLPR